MKKYLLFIIVFAFELFGQVKLSQLNSINVPIGRDIFAMQTDSLGHYTWRKMNWQTAFTKLGFDTRYTLGNANIRDSAITTSKILDGELVLGDLSNSLIAYINAAGGGSITNYPDGVTLEQIFVPDTMIKVKESWLGGVIHDSLETVRYSLFATPEQYGAVGGGITDDRAALIECFDKANLEGRKVFLKQTYYISDTLSIDLNGGELELNFAPDSKIISGGEINNGSYYSPSADVIFSNGTKLVINGGEIWANDATTDTFQCGLMVHDIGEVRLENLYVHNADYSGISIMNVDKFSAVNCKSYYNDYAGLQIAGTKQVNISGGSYSYNGDKAFLTGYGIQHRGRFPYPKLTGETERDNQNISVDGVTANYNYRKGIDIHDGLNASITNCKIKGFGYGAIYAVQELTHGDVNYEAVVRNILVSNNICEQDSSWLASIGVGADNIGYAEVINVGAYGVSDIDGEPGSFIVTNNIVDCDSSPVRAAIAIFVNETGDSVDAIIVKNNVVNKIHNEFSYITPSRTFAGILVLGDPDDAIPPKIVDVSGNSVFGSAPYGIYVAYGKQIVINDNTLAGEFSQGVASVCDSCWGGTRYTRRGNILNQIPLADMEENGQYFGSNRYAGKIEKYIYTDSRDTTYNLLKVNVEDYTDGVSVFHLKVLGIEATHEHERMMAVFEGQTYATKEGITWVFVGDTLDLAYGSLGAVNSNPVAKWMYDARDSSERFLQLQLPNYYTAYNISVEFTGWKQSPWIFETQHDIDSTGGIDGTTGWNTFSAIPYAAAIHDTADILRGEISDSIATKQDKRYEPILFHPASFSYVGGTNIQFQWDSVKTATSYQLQIDNVSNSFGSIYYDRTETDTSLTLPSFPNDGTAFYWRVRAYVNSVWQNYSDVFKFYNTSSLVGSDTTYLHAGKFAAKINYSDTTGLHFLKFLILADSPTLVSPNHKATVSGTTINFDWDDVSGATEYNILIDDDDGTFNSVYYNRTETSSAGSYDSFPNGGTQSFYWKVRYKKDGAFSDWSKVRKFTN